MRYILIFVTLSIACSCGRGRTAEAPQYDTLYTAKYAERFEVLSSDDSLVLRVHNPWQGSQGVVFDYKFPRKISSSEAPRVICLSSSHIAFLDAIGSVDNIIGVSGIDFITNPSIRLAQTPDVGYNNNLNYEMIVSLKPDYVFVYEVSGENNSTIQKLEQLGIKVIYISDYLEKSPLARSEWIVAFGAITGKIELAEEIFGEIETNYNQIKDSVKMLNAPKPKVMLNSAYRDVWYLPGDRNYMVQLLNDAGGDYLGKGTDNDVSRPVSNELAYLLLSQADKWLNPSFGISTITQLKSSNPNMAKLKAVRQGEIYSNTARSTPGGGSDFWESGSLRADRVLLDLAKIFDPEHFRSDSLYYYRRLE